MHPLLFVAALAGQSDLPPARQVMERVVERVQRDRLKLQEMGVGYLKTATIYDTKYKVIPELKSRTVWHMWYENGESFQQKVEHNGLAVLGAPVESPGPDALMRLPDLYDYSWADPPVTNRFSTYASHYAIRFKPKQKRPKTNSEAEEGLVRMEGTIYVDTGSLFITKMEASLPESFRKFLAWKVNSVHAEFSEGYFAGFWVLNRVVVKINYATLGYETHNTYEYEYEYAPPGRYQKPPAR